jgi:drug/metabolite transporter (DMT)-like permease
MYAWIAYLIVSLVWGSTYVAIAQSMEAFTPLGVAPFRFLTAAALAWGIAGIRREAQLPRSSLRPLIISGLLMLSGANALVCWAETRISSGLVGVLNATMPLILVILERQRLNRAGTLGMALGIGGVAVLTEPWTGQHDPWGVAAVLLGTVCWSLGTLHARQYVAAGSFARQASVQMAAAGVFGLVVAPLTGGYLHAPLTWSAAMATLYLIIFGSVIAFLAHGYLIRAWPSGRAGTYAFINPVVAVFLGNLLRDEVVSAQIGIGTALSLAGVALVRFFGRERSWR